ncbi:class I SAM-dependent methyltransferase [Methylobacterium sp. Leaf118]|uniref:class I SAM-dependent methyltransferase n=1 Tax=Methylobacterium sp. Leaf118 TaxID=2876562 RepID=UPI001E3602CF|nr:methyltransferase domain-containing protein [Methylobacterium sp. Leaf118]
MAFDKIWEDYIAINSQDEPVFDVLPRVRDIEERENWTVDLTGWKSGFSIPELMEMDTSPLPIAEDREGYYGPRNYEYWLSGLVEAHKTLALANAFGVPRRRFVELGAASGRVVRHFAYLKAFEEHWAFDLNWRHVCWVNRYLPKNVLGVQNSSIPTLPLEDNSVDVYQAQSVFTHIEVFELQWLAELRRTLRPGGIAIVTATTSNDLELMTPQWPGYGPFTGHPRWNDNILKELKERGKIVLRYDGERSYSSNVLTHIDYIKDVWGRMFEVSVRPRLKDDTQTVLTLRKR